MVDLSKVTRLMHFRAHAQRRLPAPLFHYIDGGADDEWSLANNTDAFARYEFLTDVLNDISSVDMSTSVFGADLKLPFFLSPTGMTRLFHHHKELGVARAAHRAGTLYSLSTLGTSTIEEVASANPGFNMFQVYLFKDRGIVRDWIARAKESGFTALALTVDLAAHGNRERDIHTGMVMPPRWSLSSLASFAAHPHWAFNYMLHPDFRIANVRPGKDKLDAGGAMSLLGYVRQQFDHGLNWKDAEWLAGEWGGPLALKGVTTGADARRARDMGASAVILSNHGGRQLDGAAAPVDCIRGVRDAVGRDMEVIVDGGVRRGSHILKALALGADACSFGRPYLYALAAAGEAGVDRMFEIITYEIQLSMALLGVTKISDIEERHVRKVGL